MTPVRKKGYLHGVIEFCSEIALTKTLVPDTAFLCDLQKQQFPCKFPQLINLHHCFWRLIPSFFFLYSICPTSYSGENNSHLAGSYKELIDKRHGQVQRVQFSHHIKVIIQ